MQHYFWLPSAAAAQLLSPLQPIAVAGIHQCCRHYLPERQRLSEVQKGNSLSNDSVTFVYGNAYFRLGAHK